MKPQQLAKVQIKLSPSGESKLSINGQDLMEEAAAFSVFVEDGKPPVLLIRVPATYLDIDGPGIVQVEPQVPADPREIVLAFLDSVSPQEVEVEAFATADYGTLASEAVIKHLKSLV